MRFSVTGRASIRGEEAIFLPEIVIQSSNLWTVERMEIYVANIIHKAASCCAGDLYILRRRKQRRTSCTAAETIELLLLHPDDIV